MGSHHRHWHRDKNDQRVHLVVRVVLNHSTHLFSVTFILLNMVKKNIIYIVNNKGDGLRYEHSCLMFKSKHMKRNIFTRYYYQITRPIPLGVNSISYFLSDNRQYMVDKCVPTSPTLSQHIAPPPSPLHVFNVACSLNIWKNVIKFTPSVLNWCAFCVHLERANYAY